MRDLGFTPEHIVKVAKSTVAGDALDETSVKLVDSDETKREIPE